MIRYIQTPLSSDQTLVAVQIVSVLIDTLTVHVNQEWSPEEEILASCLPPHVRC